MHHEGVEVGGEAPGAEGETIDVASEEGVELVALQLPKHLTSLGVRRLVIAADVATIHLLQKTVACNKDMIQIP